MATKILELDTPLKKRKVIARQEIAEIKRNVVPVKRRRISKTNAKSLRSILGDSAEEIQQLLEISSNESAISLIQKRLLQGLVDIIPYAENTIRKTEGGKGVYQLNSLITSLRELMIDLQSTRDKGAIGAALVEKIIRPAFLDLGMTLVQEDARLDNEIKDLVDLDAFRKIKAAKKESLSRIAAGIQEKYGEVKAQSITFLQS